MALDKRSTCPDCEPQLSRRDFVRAGGAALVAGTVLPGLASRAVAAPSPTSAAETVVAEFYSTLSDSQKAAICLPYNHELRRKINANWHITAPQVGDDIFSDAQRDLMRRILKSVTSEDGYERLQKQMDYDDGGMEAYSVAMFGAPGNGKFEWEMTGRHLTIRADGDSNRQAAFGGPIVYGHGEESAKDNLFHYQTLRANEVFAALDPAQRKKALLKKAPAEANVPIQGAGGKFAGIAAGELSSDQKQLFEDVVKVILAPYRQEDVDDALAVLKAGGGIDQLHLAFYSQEDLDDDKVWDIWRVEGPNFVWHFRGAPHVHAYVNIALARKDRA